jgi:alkylhydroperoxidase family enzyme
MSRVAPLEPPYASEVQESFDRIMPPGAPPLLLFRTLARFERAWRKFRAGSLLDRGPLSLRDRELVIDRTCALNGCEYEWAVHVAAFGPKVGLDQVQVRALVLEPADAPCWSPEEQTLLRAVDAIHARADLSDAEWTALRAVYDEAQALEILLLAGFYRTVSYVANTLRLPLEPGTPAFPSV